MPDSFLCGSVTSLLKKGKDPVSCSSYRPITVACTLSKLFEHLLLPYITKLALNDDNQFGFRSGLGCQHAHRALTSLLKDAHRTRRVLHFATLDLSKAFDSIFHTQAWTALCQRGVNPSVIHMLRFWYSHSYIRLKSLDNSYFGHIPVRCGVRQGGVLSPYIFNACIENVLSKISTTCLLGPSDISYLAYADDLLLISQTESGLARSVKSVTSAFHDIGLYLNIDKCEFLVFNGNNCSESLYCDGFSIPRVKSFRWLGITVGDSMNALRSRAVKDINDKLRLGYSKIVANLGHYRRRALTRLYSNFCDHSVLFCSGIRPLLLTGDLKRIRINYYRYCKFLLYLTRSYRNTKLVKKYCATDITGAFRQIICEASY